MRKHGAFLASCGVILVVSQANKDYTQLMGLGIAAIFCGVVIAVAFKNT